MPNPPQKNGKIGRLKKRQEFKDIQLCGQSWVSSCVIVQFYLAPKSTNPSNEEICKIGYTVSKKVSPLAVERNRIKRRLRACADEIIPENTPHGAQYVLIGRKATLDADYERIKKDLRWCLKRLHAQIETPHDQ